MRLVASRHGEVPILWSGEAVKPSLTNQAIFKEIMTFERIHEELQKALAV